MAAEYNATVSSRVEVRAWPGHPAGRPGQSAVSIQVRPVRRAWLKASEPRIDESESDDAVVDAVAMAMEPGSIEGTQASRDAVDAQTVAIARSSAELPIDEFAAPIRSRQRARPTSTSSST